MSQFEPPKRVPCPHCASQKTAPRKRKTAQGYSTFYCKDCGRYFNERTGSAFNKTHYPTEIISLVVLWRLRDKLSLRDLCEMFLIRGFVFIHEAVREWEERFAPLLTVKLKAERKHNLKKQAAKRWKVDETVRPYRDFNQSGTIKPPVPCG